METLILILLVLYLLMKLKEINTNLLFIKKNLDTLQYDVNALIQGDSIPSSKKEEGSNEEKTTITDIPLTIKKEATTPKRYRAQRPPPSPSILERLKNRFGSASVEDFLVGNLLLNVSIVTFVLGVGFFLKYSIDQNWIPIWGRILIGIMIGLGMLWAGHKSVKNSHKLFSEGLFGGGIAVLYISIFESV